MRVLGSTTIKVVRRNQVDWSSGEAVTTGQVTFTVEGSPQPMTDREQNLVPENVRTRARWKLYVSLDCEPLQTADVDGPAVADRVEFDGVRYVVHSGRAYNHPRLAHRRYILLKPERDDRPGRV